VRCTQSQTDRNILVVIDSSKCNLLLFKKMCILNVNIIKESIIYMR
jgi:hypothetical protein